MFARLLERLRNVLKKLSRFNIFFRYTEERIQPLSRNYLDNGFYNRDTVIKKRFLGIFKSCSIHTRRMNSSVLNKPEDENPSKLGFK